MHETCNDSEGSAQTSKSVSRFYCADCAHFARVTNRRLIPYHSQLLSDYIPCNEITSTMNVSPVSMNGIFPICRIHFILLRSWFLVNVFTCRKGRLHIDVKLRLLSNLPRQLWIILSAHFSL